MYRRSHPFIPSEEQVAPSEEQFQGCRGQERQVAVSQREFVCGLHLGNGFTPRAAESRGAEEVVQGVRGESCDMQGIKERAEFGDETGAIERPLEVIGNARVVGDMHDAYPARFQNTVDLVAEITGRRDVFQHIPQIYNVERAVRVSCGAQFPGGHREVILFAGVGGGFGRGLHSLNLKIGIFPDVIEPSSPSAPHIEETPGGLERQQPFQEMGFSRRNRGRPLVLRGEIGESMDAGDFFDIIHPQERKSTPAGIATEIPIPLIEPVAGQKPGFIGAAYGTCVWHSGFLMKSDGKKGMRPASSL